MFSALRRWSLAMVALVACDARSPAEGPSAPSDPSPVATRSSSAPEDLAVARPRKGTVIGGEEVARTLTWPPPAAIDIATRDRLPPRMREAMHDADLPVLLPPADAERGHLTVGEGWYAFSGTMDDATIVVSGSARATIIEGIRHDTPRHTVRGQHAFISNNEGIWIVSWIEHGAAYSLELECAEPRAQACATPDRAAELAQALVLVATNPGTPTGHAGGDAP